MKGIKKQLNLNEIILDSMVTMSNEELKVLIFELLEKHNCSFNRLKDILKQQFIDSGHDLKREEIEALETRLNLIFECEIKGSKEYEKFNNVKAFFAQFEIDF